MYHKILIDNRGFGPTSDVVFTDEQQPVRLSKEKFGTPAYENAQYEIRTIKQINGEPAKFLKPGDAVLFSRCEPDRGICSADFDIIRLEADAYEAMKQALDEVDAARNKAQVACEYWSSLYGKVRAAKSKA